MKQRASAQTLVAVALVASLVGAIVVVALGGAQVVRGSVQLALFPLLLLVLSALSLRGVRLPRVLVGLSAIGVLCGAIVRYSDVGLDPGAFGVARFDSDPLENTTRIFRDRVRRFMGERSLAKVGTVGFTIHSESEAREALKEHPQLGGVVWGGERWITVSIPPAAPISLGSLPQSSFARERLRELGVSDLQIISQVPGFGISKGLDAATAEFVGRFLRVAQTFPAVLAGERDSTDIELYLLATVLTKAHWTTAQHLAAPKWMLGTLYLTRAISGPELSWGDLLCAESSLRSARILSLKSGGNPAVLSAILNNESVLQLLKAEYSTNPEKSMSGITTNLLKAFHLKKRSELATLEPHYWDPIAFNMKALGIPVPGSKKRGR